MRSFGRKGQAALEFMMTYGWAILIVLAAIGALSYFGVLNPIKFTPDTCMSTSGFSCVGKPIVNDTTIMFTLINGMGYRVNLTSASLPNTWNCAPTFTYTYYCAKGNITCYDTSRYVEDGNGVTVRLEGCNFRDSTVVKGDIVIPYIHPQSKLQESVTVSITGRNKNG